MLYKTLIPLVNKLEATFTKTSFVPVLVALTNSSPNDDEPSIELGISFNNSNPLDVKTRFLACLGSI